VLAFLYLLFSAAVVFLAQFLHAELSDNNMNNVVILSSLTAVVFLLYGIKTIVKLYWHSFSPQLGTRAQCISALMRL